jgi:predicted DNA-binding transcriptional regulator AlpA
MEKRNVHFSRMSVSEMLGVAIPTLHAWRRVGKPPPFIRLGRAVRYRLSDVRELIRHGYGVVLDVLVQSWRDAKAGGCFASS